nr:L-dopachrome tautomerase-related protein [Gluconobacter cerinus]
MFIATVTAALLFRRAFATPSVENSLSVIARLPFSCSGVAVTPDNAIFLGLPRFPGNEATFSVGRIEPNGTLRPFPGGRWNEWRNGRDGTSAFVMVNAVHVFADGTLWVVDQGAPPGKTPAPGAQKLVQINAVDGSILRVVRFAEKFMPPQAQFNDLRIHGDILFVTDSGIGGIIIHNLQTGRTRRRLSAQPAVRKDNSHVHRGSEGHALRDPQGHLPIVQSDDIEVDATGTWLYFSVPAGPLKKIRVSDLLDEEKSDIDLNNLVMVVAEIPSIGGTCIDSMGNFYLSDVENHQIIVLAPDGKRSTLVQDPRLISPDALFIDRQRRLYIPCPQLEKLPIFNSGKNDTRPPFLVLSMPLPERLGSLPLGNAVEG